MISVIKWILEKIKRKKKKQWNDLKSLLFLMCTIWSLEYTDPFLTANWPKWKRKLIFNRFVEKIVDWIIDRL